MSSELENSIICLETAVTDETQELEKRLRAETHRIIHLQNEEEILRTETERMQNESSKLDEQIREVHGRFTATRQKCDGLKQLLQCLEINVMELQTKLHSEIEKTEDEQSQFSAAVDLYQQKWYAYRENYEKHPLMPKLNEAKQKMEEAESYLNQLQSESQKFQSQIFKMKNKLEKVKQSTIYSSLNKYIIELAKMKTRAIKTQLCVKASCSEIDRLKNISANRKVASLNQSVLKSKSEEITVPHSVSESVKQSDPIVYKPQTATASISKEHKFHFYVPKFTSTPMTTIANSFSTLNDYRSINPSMQNVNSIDTSTIHEVSKENRQLQSKETSYTFAERQQLIHESPSPLSDFNTNNDTSPASTKSPGFTYSTRFMFSHYKSGDTTKDDTFIPSFGSFSNNTIERNNDLSCNDVPMKKDSLNQPTEQQFFFVHSPKMSSLAPSTPQNTRSILNLFGAAEDSETNAPRSSSFSFDFGKSNDMQSSPQSPFQFSF